MAQGVVLSDADIQRRDRRVTSLIGISHGASHFYQLALPPLFVLIHETQGFDYASLGLLTAAFYVTSALCQPPSGFLVDRFGARTVLLGGLGLMSVSTALMGVLPYYPVMFVLSILAGAGNSVFHPCDYSIMNATISERRIARAFSIHMFGGYIGYAAAPFLMPRLGHMFGWHTAIILAGIVGLVIFATLWNGSRDFRDSTHERAESGRASEPLASSLRTLASAPIVLCWFFFLIVAMGQIGLQTFTPTLMNKIYSLSIDTGGDFVTAMLLGVTVGVLCGGYLADYFRKPDRVVSTGYLLAVAVVFVIWKVDLPPYMIYPAFAFVGFMYGVAFPSRELLVRAATPKGASGRVFGFVYSGMDVGSALTPVLFGWFVDTGIPRTAFLCVAVFWAISVVIIQMTNIATQRRQAVAAE